MNIEKEIEKATRLLATMMQLAGLTRQEIDRRLGAGRGFTSQVLTGRVELKLRHVLEILRVLDFAPAVFFRLLFAEPAEGPGAQRPELLHQLFQGTGSWPMTAPPSERNEDLLRLIKGAIQEAFTERPADEPARDFGSRKRH